MSVLRREVNGVYSPRQAMKTTTRASNTIAIVRLIGRYREGGMEWCITDLCATLVLHIALFL